ncbi:MAG: glycosyltransferase [Planctomycetota bacterium]
MISSHELPAVEHEGWPWTNVALPEASLDSVTDPSTERASEPVLVVTPSFNQGQYVEATLRSVILQKTPTTRYVVVDGGSTDETQAILKRYEPWIDELIVEPDEGQSDAIVKGIGAETRGWFNWINSDDMLAPGVIQALHRLTAAQCQLAAFNVEVIGDGPTYPLFNRNLSAENFLLDGDYSFAQPGCWLRLERFHEIGAIDQTLQYGFDWDLMIRYLAARPTIKTHVELGATFRVHEASKTATEGRKSREANAFELENQRICRKLENVLPEPLAKLCETGRQRRVWRQRVAEIMDDESLSPHAAIGELFRGAFQGPSTRWGRRTWMSALRLLSRYVRPNVHQK